MIMNHMIFWLILIIILSLSFIWSLRQKTSISAFLVGERNIYSLMGLLTVAVAWTWAPALLVSSQKAYELGLNGFLWFSIPNVFAIVLFYFLSKRMHKINPEGYTLPEFIRFRTEGLSDKFYIITIFIVQIYAIIINLIGSTLILQSITGLSKTIVILAISIVALLIVSVKGLFSSLGVDFFKSALIIILGILFTSIFSEFSPCSFIGKSGSGLNFLDPMTIFAFGIPTAISLISAITIDQQQWQRSFALRKSANLKIVYFGAASFFALIISCMALPGFIGYSLNIEVKNTQLIALNVMQNSFPPLLTNFLMAVILTSLIAVICAALSAAASVWTIDLKKDKSIFSMRLAMIILILIASSIVFIQNLQIIWIQMFVGSFRSALLFPSFLFIFGENLSKSQIKSLNVTIYIGMIVGPLIFLVGLFTSMSYLYTVGAVFPIAISLLGWFSLRYIGEQR